MATFPQALCPAKCSACFTLCVGSHWIWPSSNSLQRVSWSTSGDWRRACSQLFHTRWCITQRNDDFWWLFFNQSIREVVSSLIYGHTFATHCWLNLQDAPIAPFLCSTDACGSHLNVVLLCSFPSKQLRLWQWACSSSQAVCWFWSSLLCSSVTWKAGHFARASTLPSLPSAPLVLEIMWLVSRESKQALMWWKAASVLMLNVQCVKQEKRLNIFKEDILYSFASLWYWF